MNGKNSDYSGDKPTVYLFKLPLIQIFSYRSQSAPIASLSPLLHSYIVQEKLRGKILEFLRLSEK